MKSGCRRWPNKGRAGCGLKLVTTHLLVGCVLAGETRVGLLKLLITAQQPSGFTLRSLFT